MPSALATPGSWQPLPRRFFARGAESLARALLGCVLVHDSAGGRVAGRIVETEAYDDTDPASHSYRGLTPRTRVMFGPAGFLYVYFSYGVHWCANVVAGRDGRGAAVLLRALEPLAGIELMAARRRTGDVRLLCRGPGRLTQALAITGDDNGLDLTHGRLFVARAGAPRPEIAVGPRIGITRAAEKPWRFWIAGSPFVSR